MNIIEVGTYPEVNRALDIGADIVVRENKRSSGTGGFIGHYCHVMMRSDDLMKRIKQDLGWPLVNARDGHVTFFVAERGASEVIKSLESLAPE